MYGKGHSEGAVVFPGRISIHLKLSNEREEEKPKRLLMKDKKRPPPCRVYAIEAHNTIRRHHPSEESSL
jgi:hypothetical protein